jgi:hypothetical protein
MSTKPLIKAFYDKVDLISVIARLDRAIQYPQACGYWIARPSRAMMALVCVNQIQKRSNTGLTIFVRIVSMNAWPAPSGFFSERNSLNSLIPPKNSLFFQEQGIDLQSIEIAKQFRLSRISGNLPATLWNDYGNWRAEAPNRPEIFKIPC